ncbi:hypothetical protein NL349_29185, partial [Klebsiella pneumoniae]|nr:hypothetical protein [Klebsiella pneumoniae]
MEGTISPIPGWATRYRDRVEVELADIELFESWPDGPAAGEELARWGRAMVGRCNLGTAIYLIFVA